MLRATSQGKTERKKERKKERKENLTFSSYALCLITSGAIQKGVPTNVERLLVVVVSFPATPKSASFTAPFSARSTFAAEKAG